MEKKCNDVYPIGYTSRYHLIYIDTSDIHLDTSDIHRV